ncbi:MAG: hypothetical protein JNL82_07960 [Myxococcales bacterium]|nr:hypothetical protein [Myxococcales bacterium]
MANHRFPTPAEAALAETRRKLDAQRRAERDAAQEAERKKRLDKLRLETLARQIKRGIEQGQLEFPLQSDDGSLVPTLVRELARAGWSGKVENNQLVISPATPTTPPLIRLFEAILTAAVRR